MISNRVVGCLPLSTDTSSPKTRRESLSTLNYHLSCQFQLQIFKILLDFSIYST